MDPRDRLRQYLEQRREMGEQDLVLDGLSVEEVMKLLGARVPLSAALRPDAEAPKPNRKFAFPAPEDVPPARSERPKPPPITAPEAPAAKKPGGPAVPIAVGGSIADAASATHALATLDDVAAAVATCNACTLAGTAKNHVPGEGNPAAKFVCVGEAPGANEDETGRPFVGQAGQLLTKILEAIQFRREDVFICNVLKHRPPGNRNPTPEEITACSPLDRKSTRLNSSHIPLSRMPSSA